jgi:hypothetical protein
MSLNSNKKPNNLTVLKSTENTELASAADENIKNNASEELEEESPEEASPEEASPEEASPEETESGDVVDELPEEDIKQVQVLGNQSKPVQSLGNVMAAKNNKTKTSTSKSSKNLTKKNATNSQSAQNELDTNENASEVSMSEAPTKSASSENNKKQLDTLNQISINMFNHYVSMKLYHFQTELYSAHKTSDTYIEKYLGLMDRFMEVAQGIYGKVNLKKYDIKGSSHTDDNIVNHINGFIKYINTGMKDVLDDNTDLLTIRDELLSEANQLKYLLTFN